MNRNHDGNRVYGKRLVIPGFLMIVLMAAGCASNSISVPSAIAPAPVTSTVPALITLSSPSPSAYSANIATKELIGSYLVDGRGLTLYYTLSDRPGYSNLPDETLSSWPVFYVNQISVPAPLNAGDFGTYTRDNKVKQTTYRGFPLYYFFQDKIPGDTLGNKAGSVWFVVNPGDFPNSR